MVTTNTETVTVGAVRELTALEIAERELTAGKDSNYSRDAREAHADAVAISKMGDEHNMFSTEGISMPVVGQQELRTETTVTTKTAPRAEIKSEPEVLTKLRLLMDWRDGQGLLHQHGKQIELPSNEALKLLGERRAERTELPKTDDSAEREAEAALKQAEKRVAAAAKR